jgi:hypothetical protein
MVRLSVAWAIGGVPMDDLQASIGLSDRYMVAEGYGPTLLIKDTPFPSVPPFIRPMWRHGKAQPQAPAAQKVCSLALFQGGEKGQSLYKSEIAAK